MPQIPQISSNIITYPNNHIIIIQQIIKLNMKEEDNKTITDKLLSNQWKGEEDYKKTIVQLEIQNQKYRNELYELGQTVNKILDKTKIPQTNKTNIPNLQSQLQIAKKQLHNVNQFIQIYQKQLNQLNNKKKYDQIDHLNNTEDLLKNKSQQLNLLRKEVKQLTHKNRGLEYKLSEYSRKNKIKSIDQQSSHLKQLINQNKNLKAKLDNLTQLQEKKQQWLKNNLQSAKNLQIKIQQQEVKFPKLKERGLSRERNTTSLPKLQSEKKIYTKWLDSNKGQSVSKLEKELQDLDKINKMVQEKIQKTTKEIKDIEQTISKVKQKVQANHEEIINEKIQDNIVKKKDYGCMVSKRVRKIRRDWVGKFDSYRFSDSRIVTQEARIYKVLFNSIGYYQFFYYSVKNHKQIFVGKLPFDTSLVLNGKQSTFTVQYPDFIKNIKLKINLKAQRIIQMHLTSNLGVKGQFIVESQIQTGKNNANKPPNTSNKQQQIQTYYDIDIKQNEAIMTIFGCYGFKYDQKKNISAIWLQGIGAQITEDFIEELI